MSGAIEQIAAGALVDAASSEVQNRDWVGALAEKGKAYVANQVPDPAIAAGLDAAIDVLSTPESKAVLVQAAQHEVTAFAIRLNLGQRGAARAIFIAESDFDTRHALIKADNEAVVQAKTGRIAFVNSLESLILEAGSKAGAALVPFLLAL